MCNIENPHKNRDFHGITCTSTQNKMGEALIDSVQQFPAFWNKQDPEYKDQNYKDAKWVEISNIWTCKISKIIIIKCNYLDMMQNKLHLSIFTYVIHFQRYV